MKVAQRIACVTTAPVGSERDALARRRSNVTTGIAATEAAEIHAVRRGSLGTKAARPRRMAFENQQHG